MRINLLAMTAMAASTSLLGQAPPAAATAAPAFEVVAIRPAKPLLQAITDGSLIGIAIDGDRVRIGQMDLTMLILTAYKIKKYQLVDPGRMLERSSVFDIEAKLPAGATADQVPLMLQALLAERFKLTIRKGSRAIDTYALVVGKGGVKFSKQESPNDSNDPFTSQSRVISGAEGKNGAMTLSPGAYKVTILPGVGTRVETSTIAGLVDYLSQPMQVPVIDKTGLTGDFAIKVEVSVAGVPPGEPGAALDLDALKEASRSGLVTAVEKLGLKLEQKKNSVETIIVEHVERTPSEN